MNGPAEDVKDMLVSLLGLTFATDLFVGREPAIPLDTVTLFDTSGYAPILDLDPRPGAMDDSDPVDTNFYRPSVQVRVRNRSYTTGGALIASIQRVLHGRAHEVWNGTRYELIQTFSPPSFLDWQEDCARFVATFDIQRQAQ